MPQSNTSPSPASGPAAPEATGTREPVKHPSYGGDPDFMASLAKGLLVIRAFAGAHGRLTISDISRATGFTRAAVRRCLHTLRELRYVANEGHGYFLQPKVLELGFACVSTAPTAVIVAPLATIGCSAGPVQPGRPDLTSRC